jgi:hypothetical protein
MAWTGNANGDLARCRMFISVIRGVDECVEWLWWGIVLFSEAGMKFDRHVIR